jgi:hypothetical protein
MAGATSPLNAAMASARPARTGFSPLDEELALLPGSLTPRLQESLVRLSTWIPSFAKAMAELAHFTQVDVSRATANRITTAAGAAAVAVQTAAVERITQDYPLPAATPDTLLVSADGAMVPLQGGAWAEVKTLAIGEVAPPVLEEGTAVVQTHNLSYFSRLTDSTTFAHLALGEIQRRDVERARRVAAVMDGAVWLQGFVDLHCPEAVRILDFPHAVGYLHAIGETAGPDGRLLSAAQVSQLAHDLKHDGPPEVLATVRAGHRAPGAARSGDVPGLLGDAHGAVTVSPVPSRGVADRQWQRRKCAYGGGGGAAEGGGHALGACQRQPDVGVAQRGL